MAIFTIADLHLSTHEATNKSMEVFGHRWDRYIERLERNWRAVVTQQDTVVVGGDISWALTLDEALSDLRFLDALPGHKILLKGNHDFWWCTMKKHADFFEKNDIRTISFLFNNAHATDGFLLAGTRGWFQEEDGASGADLEKMKNRELLRLRASLDAACALRALPEHAEKEILVFTHFPPVWSGKAWEPFVALLAAYGIRRVFFGHVHGQYAVAPITQAMGIDFHLVSADFLDFLPKIIV